MPAVSERTKQVRTGYASRDTRGHSLHNIEALLGKLQPGGQYTISGEILGQLVHGLKVATPPPAALKPPRQTPPQPLWVRPKDAVARYGIKMTLLYRLINEERVVSKLIGGARVISVASLDALGDADPQARRRGRPRIADAAD